MVSHSDHPETQSLSLAQLRTAVASGCRHFPGLRLGQADGLDLDLSDCQLQHSCFKEARFGHARLARSGLEHCSFQQALLWGADLSGVRACHSQWHGADLSAARLQGADFSAAYLHRCCLRGVVAADSIWRGARLVEADFRSALDQLTDLGGADFGDADLSFALLQGANLQAVNLRGACLFEVNLSRADLRHADLRGCDLRDTILEHALLEGVRLDGAQLPDSLSK